MTCATDLQERHKELLPESLYTEFVKQRRIIDKTYDSNSPEYTKEITALVRRFENIADHLNKTDTYHSMRETQAIERIQAGKEYMLKVNKGKPLSAAQAINLGLQFTEGSVHPMPEGRSSADLATLHYSKELGEIIYNWSTAHQLEKLNTGPDKLKIFQIKNKMARDKIKMNLADYANADPHTKAAAVVRVLELRQLQLYDQLGMNVGDDPNFIWHTTHDSVQINAATFDGWFKDIYPLLKPDKPMNDMYGFPKEADVRRVLEGTYKLIAENNFSEFDGHSNLIFKDVESWIKYDEKYGSQGADWLHTVGQSIEKTSKRLAILQTFGPQPDAVFATIKREIGLIHPEAMKTKGRKLELSYEGVRGKIYADTGTFYTYGSALIQLHGMAQMTVSGFNAISGDVATMYTFSDSLLGNSVGEAMAHSVSGFSEIINATVSPREARRLAREAMIDVNDRYHLGSGSYIQDTPGYKASKMYGYLSKAQAVNGYFNLLDPSTTGNKLAFNQMMSDTLIKDFSQGWDNLSKNKQIYYGTHFNKADFDNIRHSMSGADRVNLMSMNKIIDNAQNLKLPESYRIGETLKADEMKTIGQNEYNPREVFIRDRKIMYASDLKGKLLKLLLDSNNQGVTVGGLKEHRQLGGLDLFKGNQYLAVVGKATRQFKTTTTAALNNTIFQYRVAGQAGSSRAMMLGVKFAYGTVVAGTVAALGSLVTKGTLPWEEEDFNASDYLIRSATTAGTFGIIGDELLTLLNPRTEVGHLLGSLNHQIYKLAQDVQPMNRAADDLRTVKMSKWLWQNFLPLPTIWGKDFKKGMVDYMNEYIKEVNRQKQRKANRRRRS